MLWLSLNVNDVTCGVSNIYIYIGLLQTQNFILEYQLCSIVLFGNLHIQTILYLYSVGKENNYNELDV